LDATSEAYVAMRTVASYEARRVQCFRGVCTTKTHFASAHARTYPGTQHGQPFPASRSPAVVL